MLFHRIKDAVYKRWFSLTVLLAAVIIASATYFERNLMISSLRNATFYCIFALFLAWAFITLLYLIDIKFSARRFLEQNWRGLLFSLLVSIVVFISLKPYFRILSDETNLLSVSRSMLYSKTADNLTEGSFFYGSIAPINSVIEKRPYLFPFFTYLAHTVTGYNVSNPFVVNFILFFILLAALQIFMSAHLGPAYGYSAVLLVAAQPVIAQCATSAGMDLAMALFSFLSFAALTAFLKDSDNPVKFQLLWINLLMLANTRYEAAAFLAAVVIMLFIFKRVKLSHFDNLLVYITPLLMLPVFWQRVCRTTDFEVPPGSSAFSLSFLAEHTLTFFKTLFSFTLYYPYAEIICILGLISALYFLYLLLNNSWPSGQPMRQAAWITFACLLIHWITVNSYYFGLAIQPACSRLFFLPVFVLSLLAVLLLSKIVYLKEKEYLLILFSAALFLYYNPISIANRFSSTMTIPKAYKQQIAFLKKQGMERITVICERPGQFIVHNYGAYGFHYAKWHSAFILKQLKEMYYERLYVIQNILYETNNPVPSEELPKDFQLRTLYSIRISTYSYSRISEVVSPPYSAPPVETTPVKKEKTGK